jgi:pyridoxine 4-dehydrogenase
MTKIEKTFCLGNDLTVNRVGFGAMRITGKGIWGQPENKADAIKVLKRAVELGVNFIDTADSYGPDVSEALIAEVLYPYPKGLVIGTKGGFLRSGPNAWNIDSSSKHLKVALEGSLRRLKLDCIDLYQLHRIDPKIPMEETFSFLQRVQEEGKVKHIGLSEVGVDDIKKAQCFFKVVSVQNKYSIDYRQWEPVLQYCIDNNIAFIPWNPINAGNLTKIESLQIIADRLKMTVNQLALCWLLNHSNNILLIPGTSNINHLEENMKIVSMDLTENDMKNIDQFAKQYTTKKSGSPV